MNKQELYQEVSSIISNWNPLDVPKKLAISEYETYIPKIIGRIDDVSSMETFLFDLVIDFGWDVKEHTIELKQEISSITRKIISLRSSLNHT